jgi:hypothetical protein
MEQDLHTQDTASGTGQEGETRREFIKKMAYVAPVLTTYQVGDAEAVKKPKKPKPGTSPTPDVQAVPPPPPQ